MREELFVPITAAPPVLQLHGTPYEQRHDWLTEYVHTTLGFVRGQAQAIWVAARSGWLVVGERRSDVDPRALTRHGQRDATGRFVTRGTHAG